MTPNDNIVIKQLLSEININLGGTPILLSNNDNIDIIALLTSIEALTSGGTGGGGSEFDVGETIDTLTLSGVTSWNFTDNKTALLQFVNDTAIHITHPVLNTRGLLILKQAKAGAQVLTLPDNIRPGDAIAAAGFNTVDYLRFHFDGSQFYWTVENYGTITLSALSATLMACYNLEGDVIDAKNGFNGVAHNITYGADGAIFNGTTSYIEVPLPNIALKPATGLSFFVAFKTTDAALLAYKGILQLLSANPNYAGYGIRQYQDETISFYGDNTALGPYYGFSGGTINDGTQANLMVTIGGGNIKIYKAGILANTIVAAPDIIYTSLSRLLIGCVSNDGATQQDFFTGTIKRVMIFASVLTLAQYVEIINGGNILAYPF